jgi:hypothetical protein
MLATLMETSSTLPSVIAGIAFFAVMIGALIWVTGMGSGRPNSK